MEANLVNKASESLAIAKHHPTLREAVRSKTINQSKPLTKSMVQTVPTMLPSVFFAPTFPPSQANTFNLPPPIPPKVWATLSTAVSEIQTVDTLTNIDRLGEMEEKAVLPNNQLTYLSSERQQISRMQLDFKELVRKG